VAQGVLRAQGVAASTLAATRAVAAGQHHVGALLNHLRPKKASAGLGGRRTASRDRYHRGLFGGGLDRSKFSRLGITGAATTVAGRLGHDGTA